MSKSHDNSLQNFLVGMVIGLLTGSLLSLLYSPNSGPKNRRIAKKWMDDTTEDLKEGIDTLKDEVENPYSKARQFLEEKRYCLEQQWHKWQARQEAKKINEAKQKEEDRWDDEDESTSSDDRNVQAEHV